MKPLPALIPSLTCPRCGAVNRPGATYIELTQEGAFCAVCSKSGPVTMFRPKEW